MQWVTPSPESTSRAVSSPSAQRDIRAWQPYWMRSHYNFSNRISIIPALLAVGFIIASVTKQDLFLRLFTPILSSEYFSRIYMSYQFLTMPSSVGQLSSRSERYFEASSPTIISFSCTSSPKLSSDRSMGRPTRDANEALGKLSPANPIFMQPVPGSQMMVSPW